MSERRLALVVTSDPAAGDLERAAALARAGRAAGARVELFFMHLAVGGLPERLSLTEALADDGCELICCAESARALDLREDDVGMMLGSQDDHAALVHRADRVVAFA